MVVVVVVIGLMALYCIASPISTGCVTQAITFEYSYEK